MLYSENTKIIWTLWWQGRDNAPLIVKRCLQSIEANFQDGTLIVLDKNNYKNYVQLPTHIMEKFEKGIITITHFSDILRFNLLSQHGGMWIDSTVYVSRPIPMNIFDSDFYTIHQIGDSENNISEFKWTAFLLGGKKENSIFSKMCSLFDAYWTDHNDLLCYFLIDYFMYMIYTSNQKEQDLIDNVCVYEGDIFQLNNLLYTDYYAEINQIPLFNKLSWKENYPSYTVNGKETVFFKIFEQNNTTVKSTKLNSFVRHIKNEFSPAKIKLYGVQFCNISFLQAVLRTNHSKLKKYIIKKYHKMILNELECYKKYIIND